MTNLELAAAAQHTAPAGPVVWILTKGELYNGGGHILGVYTTKDAARDDFLTAATTIPFDIDRAWKDDDGAVHVEGGCDFVSLEPHTVVSAPQLAT